MRTEFRESLMNAPDATTVVDVVNREVVNP